MRRFVRKLPQHWQQSLKREYFANQIARGRFRSPEPEFDMLNQWVKSGDRVIDVGANVGHFTVRLSALVGARGRVFAFEPASVTFELLAANAACLPVRNVSLFNAAASSRISTVKMSLPNYDSGGSNYYQASITEGQGEFEVITLPIDSVVDSERVSFIKIDVEGHELQALQGMAQLLQRDHPVLLVEGTSRLVQEQLEALGYSFVSFPGSPNRVFSVSVAALERSSA